MSTEKLDEKLRERGVSKLRKKAREAFRALGTALNTNGYARTLRVVKAGRGESAEETHERVPIRQALAILEADIVAAQEKQAGQDEVDYFMREVDRLADEVDGLRQDLDYHDHG